MSRLGDVVSEMNCTAGDFGPLLKDCGVDMVAVHAVATKFGNQGWVDVQNPLFEVFGNGDVLQETGHDDVVDLSFATGGKNIGTVRFVARITGRIAGSLKNKG